MNSLSVLKNILVFSIFSKIEIHREKNLFYLFDLFFERNCFSFFPHCIPNNQTFHSGRIQNTTVFFYWKWCPKYNASNLDSGGLYWIGHTIRRVIKQKKYKRQYNSLIQQISTVINDEVNERLFYKSSSNQGCRTILWWS